MPGIAAAAPKPITGKLSKPGYTALALGANGKATSVQVRQRRFRLRPPARRVTLQLRAPDGVYAGPIVVGRDGKRAIVGVKAGARLGRVVVKARKGYARPKRKLAAKWIDPTRTALARKGVPIGAGNFGRVLSRHARGPASDPDLDGIPNSLDVDDDGDLIIDDNDRSTAARASQVPNEFQLHSVLPLPAQTALNANASTVTDQQVDAALSSWGYLIMGPLLPGTELDCGGAIQAPARQEGLSYCSTGGTGRVNDGSCCSPRSAWPRFPDDFDPDGNGMGTPPPDNPPGFFFLFHGATTAQLGTGDIVIERVPTEGGPSEYPATVQYVFATVPALVSYADTLGNSGTVRYPVSAGDPGTNDNGFPAGAPAGQDVVLTLTLWRPQRRPIAGEECPPPSGRLCTSDDWIDIGHLIYTAIVQHRFDAFGGLEIAKGCPQSSYSIPQTQPLAPSGLAPGGGGGVTDLADDAPASAANTFTYTLNLSQCLASLGVSWSPGESVGLTFMGVSPNGGGDAESNVVFKRQ